MIIMICFFLRVLSKTFKGHEKCIRVQGIVRERETQYIVVKMLQM